MTAWKDRHFNILNHIKIKNIMTHLDIRVDSDVTPKTKTEHIIYLEECVKILNYTKDLVNKIDENDEHTIRMLRCYIADMLFEVERNGSIIENILT